MSCLFNNFNFLNIESVCALYLLQVVIRKALVLQFEYTVEIMAPSCYIELHLRQDQWIIYHL